ncbi:carbon monoxide dehydrogenase medium chain [Candidatus Velamenicoccus archaeovorus]|uniref:Carbon monoxide dehydrogenase medium chain n=1 Tax=Velamenicoccus archaeovorus TaxID=1930593 RepID=A0A410P2X3_VELA1|nr:FAD binding domain-containing protein [Candidatus Velamenicoccus archaeovorus]QAT16496.1 carbon monoxide dehydrogenase medium chain [Candidatus Velamenicoccus archaeovorus]
MPILKDFRYHAPVSVDEALALLRKCEKPVVLAGGTFVLNTLKKTAAYPTDVIGLRKIAPLHGIRDTARETAIGSMTTLAEIASSPVIREHFAVLAEAAARAATTPLRHMATIGGNVASRFFWVDLPVVLMALGAKAAWSGVKTKKTLTIEDFLALTGQEARGILTEIVLPKSGLTGVYFRHTQTIEVDVPIVAIAFAARRQADAVKDVRCIVNTTLSRPVRLAGTASYFETTDIKKWKAAEAAEALRGDLQQSKLDDYRLHCLCADLELLIGKFKQT